MSAIRVSALVVLAVVAYTGPARAQTDSEQAVPVPPGDEYADTDPSALTDFRPALDPYGTWTDDPSYGTVWTPDPAQVGPTFQPYDTAGSWDWADGDYVWLSDYAWGWVCFHYGRWAWSAGRWLWIPGRDYAGAWVSWRVGDDDFGLVGWAPMGPDWIWVGGVAMTLGFPSQEPWTFAPSGQLFTPGIGAHAATGNRAAPVLAHTRPYVSAQPTVAGAPAPHGPPPSVLGIDVARLALPALSAHEVRARQLSRPSTAEPLGARAPAAHVTRPSSRAAAASRGWAAPSRGAPARGRR
ncbi:MAG TPA: DUF6600 domain-containing protein [Polyangiaceae bacterium]|jgi:hypothetical protein